MSSLRLVCNLGDNAIPIAHRLAEHISAETGLDVNLDHASTWSQDVDGIDFATADVHWMCGLLTVELLDAGRLSSDIVAAPVFPDEDRPVYHSVIVTSTSATRPDDLAGRRLVINERGSWSGHHALRVHLADAGLSGPLFSDVIQSGSHDASIDMILEGKADVAAIDNTIWEHRSSLDRELRRVHVVGRTREWPAPPFSVGRAVAPGVRAAVTDALLTARPTGLDSIVGATGADYDAIRRGREYSNVLEW